MRKRFDASAAGVMYNQLRIPAIVLDKLPVVNRSRDPIDNYLLAMVEAGAAEYLVIADKRDILSLKTHGNTRIIDPTSMLRMVGIRG